MLSQVDGANEKSPRNSALWRVVAAGVIASTLCGCHNCLPKSHVWERVTHPDYMYPEHTLLHGYHRTQWVEWPEEGFPVRWSDGHLIEAPTKKRVRESLPKVEKQPELPPPSAPTPHAAMPAQPVEVAVPPFDEGAGAWREALERRRRAEAKLKANQEAVARREERLRATSAALVEQIEQSPDVEETIPVVYEAAPAADVPTAVEIAPVPEVIAEDPTITNEVVAESVMEADQNLADSDAEWVTRLSDLVAIDRKGRWTSVQAIEPCVPRDRLEEPIGAPLAAPILEAVEPAIPEQNSTTLLLLNSASTAPPPRLAPSAAPVENQSRVTLRSAKPPREAGKPAVKSDAGGGEIRLKVTASPAAGTMP